ncbi:hypothetical protein NUSPORA_02197 [Nucleospora cyclopteri]
MQTESEIIDQINEYLVNWQFKMDELDILNIFNDFLNIINSLTLLFCKKSKDNNLEEAIAVQKKLKNICVEINKTLLIDFNMDNVKKFKDEIEMELKNYSELLENKL